MIDDLKEDFVWAKCRLEYKFCKKVLKILENKKKSPEEKNLEVQNVCNEYMKQLNLFGIEFTKKIHKQHKFRQKF